MASNGFELWWANAIQGIPGNYTFSPTDFAVPVKGYQDLGWPATIPDLITLVGEDNITIKYYVSIYGSTPPITGCTGVPEIFGYLSYQTTANGVILPSERVKIATPDTMGIITGPGDAATREGNNWIPIFSGSVLPISFSMMTLCGENTACSCAGRLPPDLSALSVSFRMSVEVNAINYCTTHAVDQLSMSKPFCYNYVGGYIRDNGLTPEISDALGGYCGARYPDQDLSIFESCDLPGDDCNICPCNMPQAEYDQYYKDLGMQVTIKDAKTPANCLLPSCTASKYALTGTKNALCPAGGCLTDVTVGKDNVVAPGVKAVKNDACSAIVETSGSSTWYWLLIIIVFLILAIVVVVIIGVIYRKYSSNNEEIAVAGVYDSNGQDLIGSTEVALLDPYQSQLSSLNNAQLMYPTR